MHLLIFFCQKKHGKNKRQASEISYLQGVVGIECKELGESYFKNTFLYDFNFGARSMFCCAKKKVKQEEWGRNIKWKTNRNKWVYLHFV